MAGRVAIILLPFLVVALYAFTAIKIRIFEARTEGKYLFVSGGVFLLLASIWSAVAASPGYESWFVITAYPWISFSLVVVLVAGGVLTTLGLVHHEQLKQLVLDEVAVREGKLSVLENLQHDARGPYQLLELLNLTLREILLQFPESCGAVFLVNRSQRMLVLGAASGFTKTETAHLEHLALGGNMISRSIDLGEPSLAVQIDFQDKDGRPVDTRFRSGLVLPLCSGMERIGAIFICAEPAKLFTRSDIKYLAPIAEWLAEKIRTARLTREVALLRADLDSSTGRINSTLSRLTMLVKAISADDTLVSFCKGMNGVIGANSTQMYGLRNGVVVNHGGSEPTGQVSENFRTALIDALDRRKPVVINHEWTDSAGHTSIARSSLVYPLPDRGTVDALVLSRDSGAISISDDDMKLLQTCACMAGAALDLHEGNRRNLTRRVGIDKVLQLLALQTSENEDLAGTEFVHFMADILPKTAGAITLQLTEAPLVVPAYGLQVDEAVLADLRIASGEGLVGSVMATHQSHFVFGRREVLAAIEQFDIPNRHLIPRLFGERRLPIFVAVIPIIRSERIDSIAMFFLFDMPESERFEWERLFQLAGGLYSLRLALDHANRKGAPKGTSELLAEPQASAVNELNNHLAAVIGNAELLSHSDAISGELKTQIVAILSEAERAAALVHSSIAQPSSHAQPATLPQSRDLLGTVITETLNQARISGNLYMAGGRAREIHVHLESEAEPQLSIEAVRQFFETALARFAATAADDDSLTISTYTRESYLYLDISRHHKNFPAVEPVAGFGGYEMAETALGSRPADVFLQPLVGSPSGYAVDREGSPPAYLSFRFPLRQSGVGEKKETTTIRILAIDDQPVILDLISAMCQSLGYGVTTASSAEAGVRLALAERYDVILTDLAMPGMSGLEVARQIRRVHPQTPIILVTGWEAGIDVAKMKGAGITDVLYKPFRIEQLTDIVRSTAARRS